MSKFLQVCAYVRKHYPVIVSHHNVKARRIVFEYHLRDWARLTIL